MGDVVQLNATVESTLEAAKEVANAHGADGVIILLLHEKYVTPLADKPYKFTEFAGYLEAAKATAMFQCVEQSDD